MQHSDPFDALRLLLSDAGIDAALRFLNRRTPHRFTGIFRFDGVVLRNLHLVDAQDPSVVIGGDAPLNQTYCAIVGETRRPFATGNTRNDDRLLGHPARDVVVAYCGVLLRDESGAPIGTLCHYDTMPCEVPTHDLPLLEAAAALVFARLSEDERLLGLLRAGPRAT